jgi:hypothetical protein
LQEYFDSHSTEELAQVIEELHLSSKEQACFWEEGDHLLGTCHKADGIQYNKTRIVLKGTEVLEHFEVQI